MVAKKNEVAKKMLSEKNGVAKKCSLKNTIVGEDDQQVIRLQTGNIEYNGTILVYFL